MFLGDSISDYGGESAFISHFHGWSSSDDDGDSAVPPSAAQFTTSFITIRSLYSALQSFGFDLSMWPPHPAGGWSKHYSCFLNPYFYVLVNRYRFQSVFGIPQIFFYYLTTRKLLRILRSLINLIRFFF